MALILTFVDETPVRDHSNESYCSGGSRGGTRGPGRLLSSIFHVVLFIMLYKVVRTFKSVDETLVCDHSNESY